MTRFGTTKPASGVQWRSFMSSLRCPRERVFRSISAPAVRRSSRGHTHTAHAHPLRLRRAPFRAAGSSCVRRRPGRRRSWSPAVPERRHCTTASPDSRGFRSRCWTSPTTGRCCGSREGLRATAAWARSRREGRLRVRATHRRGRPAGQRALLLEGQLGGGAQRGGGRRDRPRGPTPHTGRRDQRTSAPRATRSGSRTSTRGSSETTGGATPVPHPSGPTLSGAGRPAGAAKGRLRRGGRRIPTPSAMPTPSTSMSPGPCGHVSTRSSPSCDFATVATPAGLAASRGPTRSPQSTGARCSWSAYGDPAKATRLELPWGRRRGAGRGRVVVTTPEGTPSAPRPEEWPAARTCTSSTGVACSSLSEW